ncbi:MAG TPA: 1-acyl-sn-glycerol-3-phosphate acyltransferase [Paludibacteraceae bacterium]|nr:1-acyl-sn-glycerol-3-phosphate acyltransferase [Paludibacteraceae bacterium]HPT42648.1 1-acyl-sn-glycerol-3-phosphate acyltransferase [Paludibacteraceae bacterium]
METYNFDDIRSYNTEEIPAAMERLCNQKPFMKVVSTLFPLMPKEQLKQKMLSFTSSTELQLQMVYPFLQYLEANMTTGICLTGLENIDIEKKYLYISNHRDIILDSALLCAKFIEKKIDTVEIAIGDNLLVYPWIEDLVRVNRSFIVQRGLNARQVLESSKRLSAYLRHTLNERKKSIWIAQREGRAKDSNDLTQESLLKMFNLAGASGSFTDNLKELNICPLSISYEFDPCDYLKAREFQLKRDNPEYKKTPEDDLINMQTGVMGYKGKVVYHISGCINDSLDIIARDTQNRNEQIEKAAQLIDYHIHKNFTITANNKIAYDEIYGDKDYAKDYTTAEKISFEEYLDKQIRKIDLENKDRDFLRRKMLEMYANPLKNYLKANGL